MFAAEALAKIKEALESAKVRFSEFGLTVKERADFTNRVFGIPKADSQIKFILGMISIATVGIEKDDEYILSMCVKIDKGDVNEETLDKTIEDFNNTVEEAIEALKTSTDMKQTILSLGAKDEEEMKKLYKMPEKPSSGYIVLVVAVIVIILVTILSK